MGDSKTLTYNYDSLEHETELAWLLVIGDEKIWLPKSICNIDEEDKLIDVPEWLAIEKGLE